MPPPRTGRRNLQGVHEQLQRGAIADRHVTGDRLVAEERLVVERLAPCGAEIDVESGRLPGQDSMAESAR